MGAMLFRSRIQRNSIAPMGRSYSSIGSCTDGLYRVSISRRPGDNGAMNA
jgi:hypothetical protein